MMSSSISDKISKEEEDCLKASQYATIMALPFVLKNAVDLDLFEIIAKAGLANSMLSATQIASNVPAAVNNVAAPTVIDRILRFLAAYSILDCDTVTEKDGNTKRLYGISSIGKYFLRTEDGNSLVPLLNMTNHKHIIESWNFFKEATIEGGSSIDRGFAMPFFELVANDTNLSKNFNQYMSNHTNIVMKKVLETYNGFEGINQVVDVGGGLGTNLKLIVSKYPQIKGINFDMPHVIKDAPIFPGVEYIGGDMFNNVPCGEVIFMKWVLHDWDDEKCLKLLRNCYDAIPENGKVIILESIVPEQPMSDIVTTTTLLLDVILCNALTGSKERTMKEFETLATEAGFTTLKIICKAYEYWVMELYKTGLSLA